MKRVIIDYKKLTPDIMVLLAKEYRLGIESSDIITCKNSENETVDAVEVKSEDTIYLVKVGLKLDKVLKSFISGGYEFDMDIHFNNY